jgi:hypothetical protein
LINAAWSSVAALAMVPFPDLLNPESEQVGKNGHTKNRRWRCTEAMISATAFDRLSELTRASDRSADLKVSPKPAVLRSSPTRTVIEAAL